MSPRRKPASTVPTFDTLTVPPPPEGAADWNDDGVVIIPGFFSAHELSPYVAEWLRTHAAGRSFESGEFVIHEWRGWAHATPYMEHPALRELCCNRRLAQLLEGLIGEPAAVHLNLTGWLSTERDWHQDSYLNPPDVGDHYAAIWVALADIDPASGPFQYVPGSHRWPQVTRELIGAHVDLGHPDWPKHSEIVLSPLFEAEIEARDAKVVTYVPEKGDLLVWHGRLLHRGSRPEIPGTERRSLIAHYSGVNHRPDMPPARHHPVGGHYFPLGGHVPVR